MGDLKLKIFDVGNGDCVLITTGNHKYAGVDCFRINVLRDHPFKSNETRQPLNILFLCLTHPHHDHMASKDEMANILDLVAQSGGEFWHTIADMAELLRLYHIPNVQEAFKTRDLKPETKRLLDIATLVANRFPRDRIRFISAEPGEPLRISSNDGVEFEILAPSKSRTLDYIKTLQRVEKGQIQTVSEELINETSAVINIRYGKNRLILGGDALASNWMEITSRHATHNVTPMGVQLVKASHHGSDNSFYQGLWDDLFGEKPGLVLLSANGVTRPTIKFIESFEPRKKRGIIDTLYCTGPLDPRRRPEFLSLEYQTVLDYIGKPQRGTSRVFWGTIEVTIPKTGAPTVSQPYAIPS